MSAYLFQNLWVYWSECSSHKKLRELGSERCKSVWSISVTNLPIIKMIVCSPHYERTPS